MLTKILTISIIATLLTNFAAGQLLNEVKERQLVFFEGTLPKNWKLEHSAKNSLQAAYEYTANGESTNQWSQLITEQLHKNQKEEILTQYLSAVKNRLQQDSKEFKWKILEKEESSVTYEWSHQGSGAYPATYEVTKLVFRNGGLYRIAYDKYTKSEDADTRYWKEAILKSKLK